METIYWQVNSQTPEPEIIQKAARMLLQGELVAFPTETVYGVGATAFSGTAASKIFKAKARPQQSPLQVHLSNMNQVEKVVKNLPDEACQLMEQFWPGPLSLILPAGPAVPAEVRGGTATVGLRMPSHPVARALIDTSGPLAATSANLSGRPSPLSADDVRADLHGRIAAVLDAGPTGSGLETTVLDLSVHPFQVLRRGGVAVEELEDFLKIKISVKVDKQTAIKHYQTKSRVIISHDEDEFNQFLNKYLISGGRVGIVYNDLMPRPMFKPTPVKEYLISLQQGSNGLYPLLREAEAQEVEVLLFAPLPSAAAGVAAAIIDRIKAAAAPVQKARKK